MLKKKFLNLLLMFLFVSSLGLFCTSYTMAYSLDELNAYLDYYVTEQNNGEFINKTALNTLVALRTNFSSKFNEIFSNNAINQSTSIIYADKSGNNYFIHIAYINNNSGVYDINSSGRISGASLSVVNNSYYNNSWNSFTSTTIDWAYEKTFICSNNNWNTSLTNYYTNHPFYLTSQQQWTFALPRSGLTIEATGEYTTAFDIRIGQDWAINDVGINIYTLENDTETQRNITYRISQASNSTQYFIELLNDDLDDYNEYYIKMYYNNLYVRTSDVQKIKKVVTPIPTQSPNTSGDGNCNCESYLIEIIKILSGDIVKAIDNNGNIVVGSLSKLQQQLEANQQVLNDIKNGLFGSGESGDGLLGGTTLESGDEPTLEDLASITINYEDDPSHEFFSWLLNEFLDVLNDDSEQTLVIPIYNNNYEIRSDVFKLEIEPLRTFIQARLVVYYWRSFS